MGLLEGSDPGLKGSPDSVFNSHFCFSPQVCLILFSLPFHMIHNSVPVARGATSQLANRPLSPSLGSWGNRARGQGKHFAGDGDSGTLGDKQEAT